MTLSTIAQSVSTTVVREYSLVLVNSVDGDTQCLTAAFTEQPSSHDWQKWRGRIRAQCLAARGQMLTHRGWFGIGYKIQSQPVLIRTV